MLRKSRNAKGHWVRSPRLIVVRHSGMTLAFKTTFEVFTRVGPDNSLEGLAESSVGLVTDQPSNVYELLVTLLEYLHRLLHPPLGDIFQRCLSE